MMILFTLPLSAQVGINADGSQPDPSAGLDVKFINKGMLPPRMTTLQRDAIPAPATGLIIYNLDCNDVQFFNGSGWVPLGNGSVAASDTGGTPPFIYAWSNSTTDKNAMGLCAGTYTVTVTDSRLCQATASWTLENPTFAAPAPG